MNYKSPVIMFIRFSNKFILFVLLLLLMVSCKESMEEVLEKYGIGVPSFKFEASLNPQLDEDIVLTVYDNNRIAGFLSKEIDVTSLVPTFTAKNGKLSVNGVNQVSKNTPQDFTSVVTYHFIGDYGPEVDFQVLLLPYTGLPVVTIHTKKESKAMNNSKEWTRASIQLDSDNATFNFKDSVSLIGRGRHENASRYLKKGFEVKLDLENSIMGMSSHKEWVFLGNYLDRTLLRNDASLYIGTMSENMEWTPKSCFVELIFNGEHMGNYQICEKITIDEARVNIEQLSIADNDNEVITGGYLFEFDSNYDEDNQFRSYHYNLPVNIVGPIADNITLDQKRYIDNYIGEVEIALKARNFETVYKLLDRDSFVDFWIINALVGNIQIATPYNVFSYKKRNDKIFAGPLWEFTYSTFATAGLDFNYNKTINTSACWYADLFKDEVFIQQVKERFRQLKPDFEKVPQYIKERSEYLNKSEKLNWQLWNTEHEYSNGDEAVKSYNLAIDIMIDVYGGRLILLEKTINEL